MDFVESTNVVFQRIEKLEPEKVSKIMGCLLLRDYGEHEMIRLAFSPDIMLQHLIEQIKLELDSTPKPTNSSHVSPLPLVKTPLVSNLPTTLTPFAPVSSLPPLLTASRLPQNGLWIPVRPKAHQLTPMAWHGFQYQFGSYNAGASCYQMQTYYPGHLMCPPTGPQPSLKLYDSARPVCGRFWQGYCKYGGSCWFLHIFELQNGDYMVLNPQTTDEILSNGSLKELEVELIELLKCRQGIPVSVSSLPILYFDQYEKVVEGYLEEIHRQTFVSRMIQVLARMTNTVCLTNRPHGRQSIILAEDVNKYENFGEERNEHELQVYLTFPSESTFTDQEVYNYFYNFGPVQEIRIPSQMRRMFGFVSFVFPETAAPVLSKINPHYIGGGQVLVKPYKSRRTLFESNKLEKVHQQNSKDKEISDAELLPNDLEVHEQPVELETKHSLGTEAVSVSQASNEFSLQIGQLVLHSSDFEGVVKSQITV